MNFDLTETQELFAATADRFLQTIDVAAREKIRTSDTGYDRDRWSELAELGLLAIAAREDVGGIGGSLRDMTVISERFGANNACDPWLNNGVLPIRLLDTAEDSKFLPALLDGSNIAALAYAEPAGRYSLMPKETIATATKEGFTISGNKQFVIGGALADSLLVTALLNNEFGLFWIDKNSAGISCEYFRIADGSSAGTITLNDVKIPAENKVNLDFAQYKNALAEINLVSCAEMVGLGQRLLDDTVQYVKEREQFGVPIGSFQVIQHALVDCFADLEQMRSLLLRTTLLPRNDAALWAAEVAGTKFFITERTDKIAKDAVQYHGAMGVTDETSVGHAMKRSMLLARLFGCPKTNLNHFVEAA